MFFCAVIRVAVIIGNCSLDCTAILLLDGFYYGFNYGIDFFQVGLDKQIGKQRQSKRPARATATNGVFQDKSCGKSTCRIKQEPPHPPTSMVARKYRTFNQSFERLSVRFQQVFFQLSSWLVEYRVTLLHKPQVVAFICRRGHIKCAFIAPGGTHSCINGALIDPRVHVGASVGKA